MLIEELMESKDLEEANMNFKEAFMLFALGRFFCPTTGEVPSGKMYNAIQILHSAQDYNWGQFILDFLLNGIKDYKKRTKDTKSKRSRNKGIGGCIFFLKVRC